MEEREPIADYSDEAFIHRRDPVTHLTDTFSELYLDSEEEREDGDVYPDQRVEQVDKPDDLPLPPPPLDFQEDELQFGSDDSAQRMCSIEEHLVDLEHRISDFVTTETLSTKLRAHEDRINYRLQRELDRVQQQCYARVDELSKSMVDCLKRRDKQLEQQFKAIKPIMSTPVHSKTTTSHKISQTPSMITSIPQDTTRQVTYLSSASHPPSVKMDLPTFSNLNSEDPIEFIDRFEEYIELRPLLHEELLAAVSVSLKGTAKSWWRSIRDWDSFKEKFLFSFLNEDHKEVAAQKLASYRQRVNECVRDFAFNYRAMSVKINPLLSDAELVQATLRNCNPRLASLLRGTVKTIDELVRLGTQIEKDWAESKKRWSQEKGEERKNNSSGGKNLPNRLMLLDPNSNSQCNSVLQAPIVLNHSFFNAVIDTGSPFSLMQQEVWQRLKRKDENLTRSAQTFMLANGQSKKNSG